MSTKIGRMWGDFIAWRAARKAWFGDHKPAPEPKLNVFQTFLHLGTKGRIALVVFSLIAYGLNVQATFSANVLSHLQNVIGADGAFHGHELTLALYLSGVVLILTLCPLMIWRAPWVMKPGIIVMAILLANASINNSSKTLQQAADMQVGTLKDKQTRMALLQANKDAAQEAWKRVAAHEHVSAARLENAKAEFEKIAKSADQECATGVTKWTRGSKCEGLEAQRKIQGDKVDKLARDKDLTDQEDELRQAFTIADSKLQAEGAKVEGDLNKAVAAPFPQLLASIHLISQDVAEGASKDQPTLDALTMEFQAWFGAPASVGLVFWIFGLFTGSKTEVERRIVENAEHVAEKLAEATSKIILSAAPSTSSACEMEPDTSETAVLGIEGDELPRFARDPQTIHEHVAAAHLKADPDKNFDRKARRKTKHKDSVPLYMRECTTGRDGRPIKQEDLHAHYKQWCSDMNIIPEEARAFGKILREELGIQHERTAGNRYRYIGVGLKLRSVAA